MSDGENHRLFLVTGTSGTGIEDSLVAFAARSSGRFQFLRLEQYLIGVASEVLGRPHMTMHELFSEPEGILRDLWIEAGRRAVKDVTNHLHDSDVLFRLNATWYHEASGGFVAGVHIPTLTDLPVPGLVITMIDDVYDTLVRLERPNKVFEVRNADETVTNVLLKLLSWREIEVRESQQIALSFLETRHVLFPMKLPAVTFGKLLDSDTNDLVYLSHPISVPRREELSVSGDSSLVNFIQDVAAGLRNAPSIVLFEPTAIDELRLDRDSRTGEVHSRTLKDRWPLPVDRAGEREELMAPPLTEEERIRAEQPFTHHPGERFHPDEPLDSLKVLGVEIRNQIRWRDRMMVEQSARPIVLRPFASMQGKVSGGVLTEAGYHAELANYVDLCRLAEAAGLRTEPTVAVATRHAPIIYHPPNDELSRQVGAIVEVVESAADERHVEDWPATEAELQVLHAELRRQLRGCVLEEWLTLSDEDVGSLVEAMFPGNSNGKPYFVGRRTESMLAGGRASNRDRARREFGGRIQTAIQFGWASSLDFSLAPFFQGAVMIRESYESGGVLAAHLSEMVVGQVET